MSWPDHTVSLPDHTVRLPDHTARLPDHTARLPDHTVRFGLSRPLSTGGLDFFHVCSSLKIDTKDLS